ncbi:MAG: dTMP kinase [Thermoplasmata archaeon]|jgi:dTMP kinase|nr:dTMP kinase [Thermoplasmata archaeon]
MKRRAVLVALEGIDGAGKTTLIRPLAAALRRRGLRVILRREPTDPALGQLAQRTSVRDPWSGAVYFMLDRFLARPALEHDLGRADVVITDRSVYSTLAYQGSALPTAALRRLEELAPRATVVPDRVILLDLSPKDALRRLGRRGRIRGPLERRRTLTRVARRYRRLARQGRWRVVAAGRPTRELVASIVADLVETIPPLSAHRRGPRRQRT